LSHGFINPVQTKRIKADVITVWTCRILALVNEDYQHKAIVDNASRFWPRCTTA